MRILLVEDDLEAAKTLQDALKNYYVVETAQTGEEAEDKAHINEYDFFLIDYLLPDTDGKQLCKSLRESGINKPIIILTGNSEIKNKVDALNSGADDYVLKPFDVDELRARIEAVFRRFSKTSSPNILRVGDLSLDLNTRKVIRGGKEIMLQRKEFDLLAYLMRHPGRVITRTMVLDSLWGSEDESFSNVVDVHIKYLRDSIDRGYEKKLIKTIYGYGYKIEE